MSGPDARMIIDFFNREAPQIGIVQDSLNNPQPDQLIQAYYFLCDLIFENVGGTKETDIDLTADLTKARPKMIIRTQQHVNMVFNKLFDGSDEFLYSDLLQPDARRTKSVMAQLIRYYNLKCDMAKHLSLVDNQIDEQVHAHEFEKACERTTNAKFHDCEEALGRIEGHNEDLMSKEWRFNEKLDAKKGQADCEKKNIERIQRLLDEAQLENEERKQKLGQEDENRKRLENNIVNSPDRILDELKHMETEVANMRQKYDQAIQTNRKLEREFGEQRVTGQCVESLISGMRKLEMLQDQMVEMRAKDEERRKQIDDLQMARKNLMADIDFLGRQSAMDVQTMESELNQRTKALSVIKQQKAQLESDEKELNTRLAKTKEDIRQHQLETKRMDRSFVIITDIYDEAVSKMLKNTDFVKQKVEQRQSELNSLAEKVRSTFGLG
uniref:Uncharacterized protein n=1 Tax=Globodera rostochiensis TaxID=31243 RepID=A0A914GWM8_GLORO